MSVMLHCLAICLGCCNVVLSCADCAFAGLYFDRDQICRGNVSAKCLGVSSSGESEWLCDWDNIIQDATPPSIFVSLCVSSVPLSSASRTSASELETAT